MKGGLGGNYRLGGKSRCISFCRYPSDEAANGVCNSLMCLDDKLGRFGSEGGGRRAEKCAQRKKKHFRPANSIEKYAKT